MGKLTIKTEHKKRIMIGMIILAGLMLADSFYQIGMHIRWRCWLPATLAANSPTTQPADTQPAGTQPADTQPAGTQPAGTQPAGTQPADKQPEQGKKDNKKEKKKAEARQVSPVINKRNIFTKVKPKGHGMKLTGVIGKIALFSNRDNQTVGIEEGQSEQGVKVSSINGYEVTIEYQGKTETMKLFSGPGDSSPPPPGGRELKAGPPPELPNGGPMRIENDGLPEEARAKMRELRHRRREAERSGNIAVQSATTQMDDQ